MAFKIWVFWWSRFVGEEINGERVTQYSKNNELV